MMPNIQLIQPSFTPSTEETSLQYIVSRLNSSNHFCQSEQATYLGFEHSKSSVDQLAANFSHTTNKYESIPVPDSNDGLEDQDVTFKTEFVVSELNSELHCSD